ncbi:39S ribosomal protein L54, mitochondrial [Rhopalosiphum maidis]|uniref:39S ribosomal protein L54, mitochondrial n=1 Tax=Rhopalosiphum maidis TaxID=43146 RepID=UPI000F003F7C|nr:39S ribosomal protein L54, mitochondrial [Rhopalosiphum maidis]XP_060842457.1 large ribosomal subunit protein mL54 [Rhopalosiphum padi]
MFKIIKLNYVRSCVQIPSNSYASPSGIISLGKSKKKLGKGGPVLEKSEIPVETDAKKLINFVCGSNILKEGQDIEIKPNSEYPDWLWNLNIDGPKPLQELDPNTKQYWLRVRKLAMRRNNLLNKLKRF